MQRSSDRSSKIIVVGLLAVLAIVMVLYFMKRSELATFQNELILAKVRIEYCNCSPSPIVEYECDFLL